MSRSTQGIWGAAWRRLRQDRVGMVSLGIVLAFGVMVLLAATGLVASDWQRERGVSNAPPSFLGPATATQLAAVAVPKGPNVDLADVDPLAPQYEAWRERAAANRAELFDAGLWGVPSFKVGNTVVWGQDRLWALTLPLCQGF